MDGAIAAELKLGTKFEKKLTSIVNAKDIAAAHKEDGAKLLELNKVTVMLHLHYILFY